MPRLAAQRLLSGVVSRVAAQSVLLAAVSTQPAASVWTAAARPAHCSGSCRCTICVAARSTHRSSCSCGTCRAAAATGVRTAGSFAPGAFAGRSSFTTLDDSQSQVDAINDRFTEAREEIEIAHDDAETTYFNESHAEAKKVTEEALQMFNDLLASLEGDERGKLQRSMGLKMEQLKAELAQLDTLHD